MWVPSGLQDGRTDEVPSAVTCRMGPAASATCALASPPMTARHQSRKSSRSETPPPTRRLFYAPIPQEGAAANRSTAAPLVANIHGGEHVNSMEGAAVV